MMANKTTTRAEIRFRVGDWVEVLSKEEILRTLDSDGRLDGMPFMPEMFAFCGKRFQVYKSAHKTCDTVFPVRGRRVSQSVHLETRCDGAAHGGCQAACMLFWKEAWLKPANGPQGAAGFIAIDQLRASTADAGKGHGCTEGDVLRATQVSTPPESPIKYACQATQLPYATTDLEWWEFSQYAQDYRSGNASLWQLFCGMVYFVVLWLSRTGVGLGRPIRWAYDHFYFLWRGCPFPRRKGVIPSGSTTPTATLDLQPGELVRVKPYREILKTLDTSNRNRGLFFDAEEVPYCGGTYRVRGRVSKIINERNGTMREMKTPSVILESVICQSRYSECRLFCPRSIYSYWREIWLDRVESKPADVAAVEHQSIGVSD